MDHANYEPDDSSLSANEATALELVRQSASLGEVCAAFRDAADPASAAFIALSSWVTEGLVSAVRDAS
jgi:hypothetical protein